MPTLYQFYKSLRYGFWLQVACLCPAILVAQTSPQPNYTLSGNQSGSTKQYQAYDFVSLKPGFSYTATTGKSFTANLLTGLPSLPVANTYAKPDGTITPNPAEGGIVGSIPGRFNVSGSGAATYSIPLECPAGIKGMQPGISLEYNSQGGDGPMGVGWSIGGLSTITKATKTVFSDNAISGIMLDNEAYALDGMKLHIKNAVSQGALSGEEQTEEILGLSDLIEGLSDYIAGAKTITGSTFESENKDYAKIEIVGFIPYISIEGHTHSMSDETWMWTTTWKAVNTGPRYFRVTTKDGRVIEYTAARNIDVITQDNAEWANFEWVVSKITDTNGNYITFSYKTNEGQTVIDKIEYTGNGNNVPFNSLVFNYETKTIVKRTRYGAIYNQNRYLLKNFQVMGGSTLLKQYDLTYAERKEQYYLENIQLSGQNSQKLNATQLVWGDDNDIIGITPITTPEPYSQQPVAKTDRYWLSADMTGDGVDDVINIYPAKIANGSGGFQTKDYVQVFKSTVTNGQTTLVNDASYDIGTGFSYATINSPNSSVLTGDINGDKKDELVFPRLDLTNGAKVLFQVAGGVTYERSLLFSNILPVCSLADINNDGIDEIIYLERVKNGQYLRGEIGYTKTDNSKCWVTIQLLIGTNGIPDRIICSDFDNDGLRDIMLTHSAGNIMFLNAGNLTNIYDYNPVTFAAGSFSNGFAGTAIVETGDFNGDGLVDFLINDQNSRYWNVGLSNGETFTGVDERNGTTIYQVSHVDHIVTDFNHDGKSDLILITHGTDLDGEEWQTIVTWYISTGTGFDVSKSYISYDSEAGGQYSFQQYNCTGDFDGDGREDVLSYGSDLYNGGNKSDNVFIQRALDINFEAKRIKSITNGLGKAIQINYQPLTYTTTPDNKPFYTKGTSAVYPVADVQFPLYCVRKVTEPDGQGGLNTTEFAYSEARTQLTGRGFLGFKTQTISNASTNRKIVSTTDTDLAYCLPTKLTTEISTASGTPVSKTETTLSNTKTGSIYVSRQLKTESVDYLTTLTSKTEYLAYDTFGNATSIKTTQGNAITTQTVSYVQRGSWCDNKPENVTITRTLGTDEHTRTATYTYDTKGNITKEISDVGDPNQLTTEYKAWTTFGQPTRTEVSANGITRFSTVTISASGRFTESITDVTGQNNTYNWNTTTGRLDSETNRIGTTSYTYNGLGQLTRTDYPDGSYKVQTAQWASPDNAYGAKFYVYEVASGGAPVYSWFDALQRPVVSEAYGLNGKKSRVFTQYRADGKTDKVSAPTFGSEPSAWDAVYDYYSDGRAKSIVTPTGTSITAYDGLKTTLTTPEGVNETMLNTAGQVYTSKVNGKTVTYQYYASGLMKSATPDGGGVVVTEYNLQGNRTKLTDPAAGTTTAYYNGLGELRWEKLTNNSTQGEITTTYNYNATTGLLENRIRNGETTLYGYDTFKRLETVEIAGQHKQTYVYGDYDRVSTLTELTGGTKTLTKAFGYDDYGRVNRETFPGGYYVENHYDDYGNLYKITDSNTPARVIWKATEANARGQITHEMKGAKETVYGYDAAKGQLTSAVAAGVLNYSYTYDAKNNLEYRTDNTIGQKEHFTYDTQNRLTNWDVLNSTTNALLKPNSITYDAATGNITAKTDLNVPSAVTLKYEKPANQGALTSIEPATSALVNTELSVTYTDFRKIKTLNDNGKNYVVSYGVDDQRRKSEYTVNGTTVTRYYFGNYEEEIGVGYVKKFHYLSGGAVMIDNNGVETLYYGYTDNQGSLIALTNEAGTVIEKYAYDPWGARRNPNDWTQKDTRTSWIVNRGYTGHEHLDQFAIINMNGRVYDPLTAMFFSPDPFIQSTGDWKNYNRYSYCMNNPTRYTDPSGYRYRDPVEQPSEPFQYIGFTNHAGGGGGGNTWSNSFYQTSAGGYHYDWSAHDSGTTGVYRDIRGNEVSYNEVHNNYIVPNAWLSSSGPNAANVYSNIRYGNADTNRQLASIANDAASRVAGIVAKTNAQWNGLVNGIDKYLGNTCKGVVNVYNVLFGYNYENNVGFVNVSMNGQPYFSERFISSAAQTTSFMGSYFEHYKGSSALSTFESGVVRSGKAIDKINIGIDYYKLFNNPSVENGINLGLDIISKKNFTIGWFTFWGTEVAPWAIEEVNQDGYRSRDIRQLLEEQY